MRAHCSSTWSIGVHDLIHNQRSTSRTKDKADAEELSWCLAKAKNSQEIRKGES
jgi:hypothetical protein